MRVTTECIRVSEAIDSPTVIDGGIEKIYLIGSKKDFRGIRIYIEFDQRKYKSLFFEESAESSYSDRIHRQQLRDGLYECAR